MQIYRLILTYYCTLICLCIGGTSVSRAEDKFTIPTIDEVISPVLPLIKDGENDTALNTGIPMLISSGDELASKYTWYGFNCLNAGWDVEAYRYFSSALQRDENCLMAHAGVVLSLISPFSNEHSSQRNAAVLRMIELVGYKVADQYVFPEKERGFALAVSYIIVRGKKAGEQAFAQLVKTYQNDLQIQLLHILLMRDGKSILGKFNQGELNARKRIAKLLEENPDDANIAQVYLAIHLDGLMSEMEIKKDLLPIARKLSEGNQIASILHWCGVVEYRAGNLKEAEVAFVKSSQLLRQWRSKNDIDFADADLFFKSQLFLVLTLFEQGKQQEAFTLAQSIANLKIDVDRLYARGSQLQLWEAQTLVSRMNVALGKIPEAIAALPTEKKIKPFEELSASVRYFDYLRIYLNLKKSISKTLEADSQLLMTLLEKQFIELESYKDKILRSPEIHAYRRGMLYARKLVADANAVIDDSPATRLIQYSIAKENEKLPANMLPHYSFRSFELNLIDAYLEQAEVAAARRVLDEAILLRSTQKELWQKALLIAKQSKDEELRALAKAKLNYFAGLVR